MVAATIVSLVNDLIGWCTVHYKLAYLVLFLGAFFEIFVLTGLFLSGEVFFLSGAILAGTGVLNIWFVCLACMVGGILGDSASYWVGRQYGRGLILKLFNKKRIFTKKRITKGEESLRKQGAKFMFWARLIGPIAWITPFIAGVVKMRYKDFLTYNIPGVIVGIGEFMVAGYFFGYAYLKLLPLLSTYAIIATCVIFLAVISYYGMKHIFKKRYVSL